MGSQSDSSLCFLLRAAVADKQGDRMARGGWQYFACANCTLRLWLAPGSAEGLPGELAMAPYELCRRKPLSN